MKFKEWWTVNKIKIVKIGNFWLLPKKFKLIVKIIISAVDIYLESEADESIASVPLKDIDVFSSGQNLYLRHKENLA